MIAIEYFRNRVQIRCRDGARKVSVKGKVCKTECGVIVLYDSVSKPCMLSNYLKGSTELNKSQTTFFFFFSTINSNKTHYLPSIALFASTCISFKKCYDFGSHVSEVRSI